MLGNAWQWTEDCWNAIYASAPVDGSVWSAGDCSKHVARGGSWSGDPVGVRAASRVVDGFGAGYRNFIYGFRVARTLP
jgi:formylglycine-generating enzyme required for sulfatase activity